MTIRGDPIWLPQVLREAGLVCNIYPGAFDRGHGDLGELWGILCHHTGSFGETPRGIAEHPTLGLASQLYLSKEGEYTLCGVGIAWHAGLGSWPGVGNNNGNLKLIGIEAANDGGGVPGKRHRSSWSDAQYNSYVRGCAAIIRHMGYDASHVIAHREWAGHSQGKWDPGAIDMNIFRRDVTNTLSGTPPQEDWMNMPDNAKMLREIWDKVMAYPQDPNINGKWKSRARYSFHGKGVDDTVGMLLYTDANLWDLGVEFAASEGFEEARKLIARRAKEHPEDTRAAFFANKYPPN